MRLGLYSKCRDGSETLVSRLRRLGHHVVAVDSRNAVPEHEIELILVHMDARTDAAVAAIKEFSSGIPRKVPLIAVGPAADPRSIRLILAAGAADYVSEPALDALLPASMRMVADAGAEVNEAERFETLRLVAARVAHDFNNLLAAILGNAELALLESDPQSHIHYSLEEIEKASRQAAELTRQLLTFSRPAGHELKPLSLAELLEDISQLLRVVVSRRCIISYDLAPGMPRVIGEPTLLKQAIVSLVTGLAGSLGCPGGSISIRASRVETENGTRVLLEFHHPGAVMQPSPAAREIARMHGARIETDPDPAGGARVKIVFPSAAHDEDAAFQPDDEQDWRGAGTILLVDADAAAREAQRRVLRRAGFTVLETGSGSEAIELFGRYSRAIQAVIIDLHLPGEDGPRALHRMREAQPEMRIVVSGGLEGETSQKRLALEGNVAFLRKPFQAHELPHALKRVLAGLSAAAV